MAKKRTKKYNPKKVVQQNAWLIEDYIVFAIDSIALGVRNKLSEKVVVVGEKAYNALQHGVCKRNVCCGVIYKDDNAKPYIEIEILELSRCTGAEAMTVVNANTKAMCQRIGVNRTTGRFYFITGDLNYEWEDPKIYQWLDEYDAFNVLVTREEYIQLEKSDIEENMKNYDPKKTQIGGDHYSRLAVQPIEVINMCRLNWQMANAFKYIARYRFKNGRQDLAKAYDYLQRELHSGLEAFYQPRPMAGADTKLRNFLTQYDNLRQQQIMLALYTISKKRYKGANDKWEADLKSVLFELNELCKVEYGTNAY